MKVRKIRRRYTWYSFGVAMFPKWSVKPMPGYRWVGKEMVRRK